jgi:biotin synthase
MQHTRVAGDGANSSQSLQKQMTHDEIVNWLRETDPPRLEQLWRKADLARQENVGGEVHLRGLIELSNHCVRLCGYCGLRAENSGLTRYRMSEDEILHCAKKAVAFKYGTVVLQAGEDLGISCQWMEHIVRRIKAETPLAITLSLGERDDEELAAWRDAGADRYLLRFETGNRKLYERIHPPRHADRPSDRIAMLATLRRLGYEVGSGVMIGIPGQTFDDLANDIELFAKLDLDMIGAGPYLPHPDTPLGAAEQPTTISPEEQVPGDELTTYR